MKRNDKSTTRKQLPLPCPKKGQPEKYEQIRAKAKELAYLIEDAVPNSREKALAMTNLEQATFWANAGIARNE